MNCKRFFLIEIKNDFKIELISCELNGKIMIRLMTEKWFPHCTKNFRYNVRKLWMYMCICVIEKENKINSSMKKALIIKE